MTEQEVKAKVDERAEHEKSIDEINAELEAWMLDADEYFEEERFEDLRRQVARMQMRAIHRSRAWANDNKLEKAKDDARAEVLGKVLSLIDKQEKRIADEYAEKKKKPAL